MLKIRYHTLTVSQINEKYHNRKTSVFKKKSFLCWLGSKYLCYEAES